MNLSDVSLLFMTGASVGAAVSVVLLKRSARKPPIPNFVRLGGRAVDENEFSPAMFGKIREQYNFATPAKAQTLTIVDLTSTCAMQHATRERVALIARNVDVSNKLTAGLPKSRAELNCHECGKLASLTSKAVVWQGSMADWDGAV